MQKDQEAIIQILNAFKDGEIDFKNVPVINDIIDQKVDGALDQLKAQETMLIKQDRDNYNKQVNQLLVQKMNELTDERLQHDFDQKLAKYNQRLRQCRQQVHSEEKKIKKLRRNVLEFALIELAFVIAAVTAVLILCRFFYVNLAKFVTSDPLNMLLTIAFVLVVGGIIWWDHYTHY